MSAPLRHRVSPISSRSRIPSPYRPQNLAGSFQAFDCSTGASGAGAIIRGMDSGDVIDTLRRHEQDLRSRGVRHAALFGSVARGTAGPASDIDIMIDIEPEAVRDVYAYVGLKRLHRPALQRPG